MTFLCCVQTPVISGGKPIHGYPPIMRRLALISLGGHLAQIALAFALGGTLRRKRFPATGTVPFGCPLPPRRGHQLYQDDTAEERNRYDKSPADEHKNVAFRFQ
jgi:hypothetical protein